MQQAKIEIYTTPSCAYCHMAKEYFKSKNLVFQEYDVMKDAQKRQEMITETGQMGVPVIKINGKIVIGFNKGKINELLGLG
ncbi:MAG: Glutaredoxin-related protein [Parcubacteria group bacterium Gr01-1014_44]|nr:MAG: Glutaredoxin-related protein [Parcubacteria group bacterium Gr01-1014_44]